MRKRKRKFNTFILQKNDLFIVLVIITLISLFGLLFIKIDFSANQIENFILKELPVIGLNSPKGDKESNDFFSAYRALAQALPPLNTDISRTDLTTANKEQEDHPQNTPSAPASEQSALFPIAESNNIAKNLVIKNETTYTPDINSLLNSELNFKNPEILIVHTHASESYNINNLSHYTSETQDRTLDTNYNVVRIGTQLTEELINYGFKVTHARNINDYPSYNQSYNKTLKVINDNLTKNPNIQIVLDIHRDAVVRRDGTKIKMVSEVNGEACAQVMIVCGTNQAGLENDSWQENLKFALKLQNHMEINYPGLARPLNLRQERFNTHATPGSMIIEVGTSGNTLEEALNSTKYLAKTIKEILK